MENILKNDSQLFYKNLITIGIPIAMQQLVGTALNMIDTVMIGSLREEAIAAVSIANRWFFLYVVCLFGIYSGMSIFTSQYWGVCDIKNIRRILGMALTIGMAVGSFFCLVAVFFPVQLMSLFIQDPIVIQYGVEYLQIIGITYFLSAVSFAFTYVSRSVHRTKIPMVASVVALSINTCFNYLLIYGKFGFPELGVQGAALATVLSRIIEIVLMLFFIYKGPRQHPLAASVKELVDWDFKRLKEILKKGVPVFVNDSLWALGNTVFYIAFGYLGAASIAAIQIAFILSDGFWAFFIGVGSASSVIVGNEIGRNQFDLAWKLSLRLIKISCVLSIIATVFMILLMKPIGALYNITPETKILLERSIFVIAIYLLPRNINYLLNVGILRSGGDSKYAMLLDVIMVWGIAVPLAFISVLVWKLPIYWVIAIVYAQELIKILFLIHRYQTKKWLKNIIV
ncbi:MATE family efflux transporter [Acetobacterium bakii]|uniref:Multidrug transporter MATE n=1 Tax=Acetobacterium bakii TaxID=52689 RepID=A0A0L6U345_9FIRM|nr:MATE family efflux transporter [Acetobacterium bakii]KNZ42928.1 hypothetical protein AKG39_04200 [Acetobacterium bakii]